MENIKMKIILLRRKKITHRYTNIMGRQTFTSMILETLIENRFTMMREIIKIQFRKLHKNRHWPIKWEISSTQITRNIRKQTPFLEIRINTQ
jgi:hypothetical protein